MSVSAHQISGSSQALVGRDCAYFGYSLRETAAAAAVIRIREVSATGNIVDTIAFTASTSKPQWYGPNGIRVKTALYVEVVSGTVEGSIFAS